MGALNLAVMSDGEQLQWHFDQTDFVVSLAIQDAEEGGDFEVAPQIRTADDEHYDDVAHVLAGERGTVVTLPMTPGHVAGVRRPVLDASREPDRGFDAAACRAARLRHQARHDVERAAEGGAIRAYGICGLMYQVGEGFAGEGADAAHMNTVLGSQRGPRRHRVGDRAGNAERSGHTPFLAVVRPNVPVQPPTLFVNKGGRSRDEQRTAGSRGEPHRPASPPGVLAALRAGVDLRDQPT